MLFRPAASSSQIAVNLQERIVMDCGWEEHGEIPFHVEPRRKGARIEESKRLL